MPNSKPHISLDEARAWLESLCGTKWVSVEKGENGREWPVGDLAKLFLDSYANLEEQYETLRSTLEQIADSQYPMSGTETDEERADFHWQTVKHYRWIASVALAKVSSPASEPEAS